MARSRLSFEYLFVYIPVINSKRSLVTARSRSVRQLAGTRSKRSLASRWHCVLSDGVQAFGLCDPTPPSGGPDHDAFTNAAMHSVKKKGGRGVLQKSASDFFLCENFFFFRK